MSKILLIGLYSTEACPVFTLQACMGLKSKGHEVFVILPDDVVNRTDWIKSCDCNHLWFLHTKKNNRLDKIYNVVNFFKVHNPFKKIIFDTTFFMFYHRWNTLILKRVKGNNNVLFLHDPVPHSDEKKGRLKLQVKQSQKMSHLVVLSKIYIETCKNVYKFDENNIIYMPHPLLGYNKDKLLVEYDDKYPIRFLFFGRITKYKGLNVLLSAFKKLSDQLDTVCLDIVGGGDITPYAEDIKKSKNVNLVNNYINDLEIGKYFLKKNTICVLPYTDATQSGVITIAYEYGNAIIASNTGGLKEQLDNGKLGILCEPNDVESLYQTLYRVCNQINEVKIQQQKIIEFSKCLQWEYLINQTLSIVEGVENE